MKLNTFIAAGLTATLLSTSVSFAQTAPASPTDIQIVVKNEMIAQMPEVIALIESLKAEGFTFFEIRRTLLGRAKVMAEGPEGTREVVMSTATGEVMRDVKHNGEHMEGHGEMGDGEHGQMGDGNMGDSDHGQMGDGNMGDDNRPDHNGGGMGGGMGGN